MVIGLMFHGLRKAAQLRDPELPKKECKVQRLSMLWCIFDQLNLQGSVTGSQYHRD